MNQLTKLASFYWKATGSPLKVEDHQVTVPVEDFLPAGTVITSQIQTEFDQTTHAQVDLTQQMLNRGINLSNRQHQIYDHAMQMMDTINHDLTKQQQIERFNQLPQIEESLQNGYQAGYKDGLKSTHVTNDAYLLGQVQGATDQVRGRHRDVNHWQTNVINGFMHPSLMPHDALDEDVLQRFQTERQQLQERKDLRMKRTPKEYHEELNERQYQHDQDDLFDQNVTVVDSVMNQQRDDLIHAGLIASKLARTNPDGHTMIDVKDFVPTSCKGILGERAETKFTVDGTIDVHDAAKKVQNGAYGDSYTSFVNNMEAIEEFDHQITDKLTTYAKQHPDDPHMGHYTDNLILKEHDPHAIQAKDLDDAEFYAAVCTEAFDDPLKHTLDVARVEVGPSQANDDSMSEHLSYAEMNTFDRIEDLVDEYVQEADLEQNEADAYWVDNQRGQLKDQDDPDMIYMSDQIDSANTHTLAGLDLMKKPEVSTINEPQNEHIKEQTKQVETVKPKKHKAKSKTKDNGLDF